MEIRVSGHQMNTGEALQMHASERLTNVVDKYFSRALSSTVTFGRAPAGAFRCDIVTHVMQGLVLKASNDGTDAHGAFDGAADKIEKQLRRYMRRLKDRKAGGVVLNGEEVEADAGGNAGYTLFQEPSEDEEPGDAPLIIAETRVDVPEATVSDAVMMLDLRNTQALMFRNSGTGAYNMVYRRGDGTIGWVEPQRAN